MWPVVMVVKYIYIYISYVTESKLAQYSHVLASTNPFKFKPLPSCPQYHWVVPRPFNSSTMRFMAHARRGPSSILEGGSDIPNRNLKAHGRLDVQVSEPVETSSSYMLFAIGVVCTLCIWLLCRQKRSRLRGKRKLFGMLPSSI